MSRAPRRRRRRRAGGTREHAREAESEAAAPQDDTPGRRPLLAIEELWDEVLASRAPPPRPASLHALELVTESVQALRRVERLWIARARDEGHPWTDIAAALGIATSSARGRLTPNRPPTR